MTTRTLLSIGIACALLAPAAAQTARERAEARKQIRRFSSADKQERAQAAQALRTLGAGAVRDLVAGLGDANIEVAKGCCGTLALIGEPAIPACIEALGDEDQQRRGAAMMALVQMGDAAVPALDAAARDGTPMQRAVAAKALEKLGREAPTPAQPADSPSPAPPGSPAPSPAPSASPQPQVPETEVPDYRGRGPAPAALPVERRAVDDARAAQTTALLERIEAHVDAGELAEAKALMWGLWAHTKREQVWITRSARATRKRDALAAVESRFRQARDLCYGALPPLAGDDGTAELLELIGRVEAAAAAGDQAVVRGVLMHVMRRNKAGVGLTQESADTFNALIKASDGQNRAATQAALTEIERMGQATNLRGGQSIEAQMHRLHRLLDTVDEIDGTLLHMREMRRKRELMAEVKALYDGVRADLAPAREALTSWAANAPDPDFTDNILRALAEKGEPQAILVAQALGGLRHAVYGEALLAAYDVGGRLGGAYLEGADGALDRALRGYMRDKPKVGAGELAQVASALELAEAVGADPAAVAARRERVEQLRASAGVGKLQRALRELDAAAADFALSVQQRGGQGACEDGRAHLARARDWALAAEQAGVGAADQAALTARLAEVRQQGDEAGAGVVAAKLEAAESSLGEVAGHLEDGAQAYLALGKIDYAERKLAEGQAALGGVADAYPPRAALQQRVSAGQARVEAASAEVVEAQRLPTDAYEAGDGASWRGQLERLVEQERGWEVLALAISSPAWKEKTVRYEYAGGGNTTIIETRWHRYLFAWAAVPDPEDPARVELRKLGFRQHKFTDGSYRKLELYYVDPPVPMLREHLEAR